MTTSAATGVVADTNVIAYLLSNKDSDAQLAERYRPHLENRPVAISFQTEGELRVAQEVQEWDHRRFESLLSGLEVIPWSEALLACYVRVRSASIRRHERGQGPKIDAADGWVAAAALLLDCPLVTHDRSLSRSPLIETITELGE